MNKKILNYVLQLALQHRLSLKELCQLLGRNTDRESQIKLYNEIMDMYAFNFRGQVAYQFLFNYDTSERHANPEEYRKAKLSVLKYIIALRQNNEQEIRRLESELTKLDEDVRKIKYRHDKDSLTLEDAITISKYRIKYGLPRESTIKELNVSEHSLRKKEALIEDEEIQKSLKNLIIYYSDVIPPKKWTRK